MFASEPLEEFLSALTLLFRKISLKLLKKLNLPRDVLKPRDVYQNALDKQLKVTGAEFRDSLSHLIHARFIVSGDCLLDSPRQQKNQKPNDEEDLAKISFLRGIHLASSLMPRR